MKNHTRPASRLKFATGGQRAITVLLLLAFLGLVVAARSGRYDHHVNRMAGWLESRHALVVEFLRATSRKR